MMRVRLRRHALDFRDGDHRQEAQEQQEQREEQTERAEIGADVHPGRREVTPVRRQEVAVQRGHDDHEPLEPHADVHEDRDDEHDHEMFWRTFLNQKSCGMTTLQTIMIQ